MSILSSYITIDETMLSYHIKALHVDMDAYTCPHCDGAIVTLDEMSAHLKCHGELLLFSSIV